jgi:hypothetical protein
VKNGAIPTGRIISQVFSDRTNLWKGQEVSYLFVEARRKNTTTHGQTRELCCCCAVSCVSCFLSHFHCKRRTASKSNIPLPLPFNMNSPFFLATETQLVMEENSCDSRKRKLVVDSDSQDVNTLPLRKRLSRGAACVSTSTNEDSNSTNLSNEDDNHRTQVRKKILAHM